jgi:hypothetical protein
MDEVAFELDLIEGEGNWIGKEGKGGAGRGEDETVSYVECGGPAEVCDVCVGFSVGIRSWCFRLRLAGGPMFPRHI